MITSVQIKMARAAMGWGVRDVAKLTGLAANTIHRLETTGGGTVKSLLRIQEVFEREGIRFHDDLTVQAPERMRASAQSMRLAEGKNDAG